MTLVELEYPKIERIEGDDRYAKFACEPLPPGYGTTLGNSLRRVLLSSLPGAAITRAAVIAAPGSELRSTRRSEFPRVVPYPGGSGSHANFAYRSSPSMRSILGYSSSTRVMASVPSCGASA